MENIEEKNFEQLEEKNDSLNECIVETNNNSVYKDDIKDNDASVNEFLHRDADLQNEKCIDIEHGDDQGNAEVKDDIVFDESVDIVDENYKDALQDDIDMSNEKNINSNFKNETKENNESIDNDDIVQVKDENIEDIDNSVMEKMIFVVDRIEDSIAVCENRLTGKMIEINLADMPEDVHDGTVLKLENGKYEIDVGEQQKIEERIKKKMELIWND